MGAQPFLLALYIFCPLSITVFSICPKLCLLGTGGHLRAAMGLMHKHAILVCRPFVLKGSREPLACTLHPRVFWSRPICFFCEEVAAGEGTGRKRMHFSLCAAASLLWQPEKRKFLSLPRPSTPCSLLIIFG